MPSRPDLREISSNVKDAFADADRDTLLEVLTFVLKEYVVEGPPPMLVHQAETLADLRGASFATLISALQTRFDHAELAMFVVDGENVGVRIGGVVQPLLGQRTPPAPAPGVRVVEAPMRQAPAPQPAPQQAAAPAVPAPQASAPPPSRGLSIRGRPSGGDEGAPATPPPATPPPAPAAAQPAAPQAGQASGDKPETAGGDDASARFSLLELD